MTTSSGRLAEVKSYFDNGDNHVGYRRLLDSAIETQDSSLYESTLAFCDWYDLHAASDSKNATQLNEKVSGLLEKISKLSFVEPGTFSHWVLGQRTFGPDLSSQFIVSIFICDILLYACIQKMAYHAGGIVS